MTKSDAVVVDRLTRTFGELVAVDGVSFRVRQGELFGFLGPNGAGKSTTIHMLSTLLRPSSGTATVAGYDVATQPEGVRRSIGLVFQEVTLDESLTGLENLRFYAQLYGVGGERFQARAMELLDLVGLSERAGELVGAYSGGMKRRLEIARGLIHAPGVLFLDEPTLGLDAQARRDMWSYLGRLRAQEGATIFVTTHYIEEAEACDRVAILDRGRLAALDTPGALKRLVGAELVSLRTSDNDRAARAVEAALGLRARSSPGGALYYESPRADELIPRLLAVLGEEQDRVAVLSASLRQATLEDAFIKLTGRDLQGDNLGFFSNLS